MSTAFLNKVYDVYENRDYFGIGCDNLNPVREIKSSQAEMIDESQVLNAVKIRLERVKKTVSKLRLDIEDSIDTEEAVVSMDTRGDKLPVSAGISPKEAMIRTKMGTPIDATTIFGDIPEDSADSSEIDALEKEIQKQIINIIAFASVSGSGTMSSAGSSITDGNGLDIIDNISSPFTVDCDGVATEITDKENQENEDDQNESNDNSGDNEGGEGGEGGGEGGEGGEGGGGDDDDDNDDDSLEEAESAQDEKDDEDEANANEAIMQCALKELAFLKIILMILKIVKILRMICAYVISTIYIVMDIVQLAAGAWLNPTNIAKIANKIIQRVLAAVVMIIFKLIQKLWNLLNLNCISDLTQDLIDQIKSALSMLEEMKSLCDPNSISFSPSEIIQSLQKSIEEAVANAADTLQNLDLKQQGKELASQIAGQLEKSAKGMAAAVKKAAMSEAVRAYNESKEMFDRAKALLGKSSNKTVKDMASAADTLGLTGIESV